MQYIALKLKVKFYMAKIGVAPSGKLSIALS